ncbi:hypothetical protein F2P81_018750 [Scophthalmus maximus]|uniref:Uncharacterized protein n=1 Tax=Scophthalmus maximus TaxID=52904 RepID=A0A6A4SB64_SCOMX|nr:hypothetical protein F2P81_018750 [Scophthalmus maximus]
MPRCAASAEARLRPEAADEHRVSTIITASRTCLDARPKNESTRGAEDMMKWILQREKTSPQRLFIVYVQIKSAYLISLQRTAELEKTFQKDEQADFGYRGLPSRPLCVPPPASFTAISDGFIRKRPSALHRLPRLADAADSVGGKHHTRGDLSDFQLSGETAAAPLLPLLALAPLALV